MNAQKNKSKSTERTSAAKSKKTAKKQHALTPEEYNAVVANAELRAIRLMESNFFVKPEFYFTDKEKKHKINGEFQSKTISLEDGIAAAHFDWTVKVQCGRSVVLKLTTTFMILYSNLKNQNENAISEFLHQTARFTSYPYFRNYASVISGLSDAELPIMPVISTLPKTK